MNPTTLAGAIAKQWDAEIVPELVEYIRVPAKSPHFDPEWKAHGHIEKVIKQAEAWVQKQSVRGMVAETVRLPSPAWSLANLRESPSNRIASH